MLKGTIALIIRYVLLIGGGALASAGVITATGDLGYYCFDAKVVADATSTAIALALGGSTSICVGILWRAVAKRLGGIT
ncbi:MAG: hypothetical protein AB7U46_11250 [Paenirhodobacter sp.]|uniref:hypothetical protein n=1 Tax=Paenirhodobacter sp. TaxID=1965326 RepID=UPI003D0D4562